MDVLYFEIYFNYNKKISETMMEIEDKVEDIKNQLIDLCKQFNEEYKEFVNNKDRINAFKDTFKKLDYLYELLKNLRYAAIRQRSKN